MRKEKIALAIEKTSRIIYQQVYTELNVSELSKTGRGGILFNKLLQMRFSNCSKFF